MKYGFHLCAVAVTGMVWGCSLSPDRDRVNSPAATDDVVAGDGTDTPGDPVDTPETPATPSTPLTTNYDDNVKSILATSCLGAGCHTPPAAGGVPMDTYDNAKTFVTSAVVAINAKRMPPAASGKTISAADTAILQKWIDTGMLENATSVPAEPAALTEPEY
jgi:hypothetical protein